LSHQVKIFLLEKEHFNLLLRGQLRVRNLPQDGDVVGVTHLGARLGFTVFSPGYAHADPLRPLPTVQAVVERL
jgi:hypothetical protein